MGIDMLEQIIREIEKSLKNECFIAALSLALTLPDICGKAEYPNEHRVSTRYISWYDKFVGDFERSPHNMPYLSGEILFQLRNCVLHQGTPSIDFDKQYEPRNTLTNFVLTIERVTQSGSSCIKHNCFMKDEVRTLEVNLVNICWKLCAVAHAYYTENKDRFNFFNYDLRDQRNGEKDIFCGLGFIYE